MKISMQAVLFLFISFFSLSHLTADPWGKDAELSQPPLCDCASPSSRSLIAAAGESMIRFHQIVISPADGPRSHYLPSSSQYTLEAIRSFGFLRGYLMGCDRLMRENNDPWIYRQRRNGAGHWMKYDPVTCW